MIGAVYKHTSPHFNHSGLPARKRTFALAFVAAETTRMAMVFTDAKASESPIIFANDSFHSLTGYDLKEVLGQSFDFLMAQGADVETMMPVNAAFERDSNNDPEIHYCRKDGSEFWASVLVSPVRNESGDVVQH